jgi:hypothetical protein
MKKLILEDPMSTVDSEHGNMFTTMSVLVSEDSDGEVIDRLCTFVRIDNIPDPDDTMVFYVVCGLDNDRIISYRLESLDSFKFNDNSGEAEFASNGIQYRIRSLQDSDSSWTFDTDSSGPTKETGATK